MFRGRYVHSLDLKGRVSIPAKFREVLQAQYNDERLVLTQFDNCIWCYPLREWERIEKKVSDLPQFKKEVKVLQRLFISAGVECPVDRQGRMLVPVTLREYAHLERDVLFVGMSRRIELWDKKRWEVELNKANENRELLDSMEEVLAEFDV